MKKCLILALVLASAVSQIFAADAFDKFNDQIAGVGIAVSLAQDRLDYFAKDLGAVMNGGSFHHGKNLGLPGFDIGVHVAAANVDDKDSIVKSADLNYIAYPSFQAEVGLPSDIDLLVRFSSVLNSSLVGGGVRYGILRNSTPFFPNISVQATYNALSVSKDAIKFKATGYEGDVLASFNLPIVDPYIGVGYYSATVTPDDSIATPQAGMKGNGSGTRVEAGVNMGLIPLTYLSLGATFVNGGIGGTVGLGARF